MPNDRLSSKHQLERVCRSSNEAVMSAAFDFGAVRFPAARKLAITLLVVAPMLALCVAHAFGTTGAGSVQNPEFGYAEWASK
jgi:hypothetical protein